MNRLVLVPLSRGQGNCTDTTFIPSEMRVVVHCPAKEVCEMLGCSKDKALKVLAELENYDGIGLIERKKHGQGRPANIYVKKIEVE